MKIKELESISIIGLGLLGGSVGMAVARAFPHVRRLGYSHRPATRQRALEIGAVDTVCPTVADAVRQTQLVILASPIGTFPQIMTEMAPALTDTVLVTDVGSTKVLPARWARKILPRRTQFLGSHPMAGSEQRGVDFARADLFDAAHCIITPTSASQSQTINFLERFWQALGMLVCRMSPAQHDRVLAQISHLPHVVAAALINCTNPQQMLLCGKGFLDTTRIASGPPNVWRDILMANTTNTSAALGRLIKELNHVQKALQKGDDKAVAAFLSHAQTRRNNLVQQKLQRKELPA